MSSKAPMPDTGDGERNTKRDGESGRYTATYSVDDAVAALRELEANGSPFATSSEVAEEMGSSRRTALNKLNAAEEAGVVKSRKTSEGDPDASRNTAARLFWLAGEES